MQHPRKCIDRVALLADQVPTLPAAAEVADAAPLRVPALESLAQLGDLAEPTQSDLIIITLVAIS